MKGNEASIRQVREVLEVFDAGYRLRDASRATELVSSLFAQGDNCIFIGTGDGEFVHTVDDIRDIVEGDWLYWGDVALDVQGAEIVAHGDFAWFAASATWTKQYDAEDVYRRAAKSMRENLEAAMPAPAKTLFLTQGPLHVLMQMERGTTCVSPLRLTGVLERSEGAWRFHRMQFSFPAPWMPDVRLTTSDRRLTPWDPNEGIADAGKSLAAWRSAHPERQEAGRIKAALQRLQEMHDGAPLSGRPLFAGDCISCDVGSTGHLSGAEAAQAMVESHRGVWDNADLGFDNAAISVSASGDSAWVASSALVKKHKDSTDLHKETLQQVRAILSSTSLDKVQLIEAVRTITRSTLHAEGGAEFVWPLRLEAVLTCENNEWLFRQIQYSHPSDWTPPEVRDFTENSSANRGRTAGERDNNHK